VNSS